MPDAAHQAHLTYRRAQIMTAGPMQLVLMLYNGARLRTRQAQASLVAGDRAAAATHIDKAQQIVGELMASLDLSAGEVAGNLFRLYEFVSYRLISARIRNCPDELDIVLEVLANLEDAWAQVGGAGGGRLTEGVSVAG